MSVCKKVHEKAVYAGLKPNDKCEIVMKGPTNQKIIHMWNRVSSISLSNGPFISATLLSDGETPDYTGHAGDYRGTEPKATVQLETGETLTQTDFPGGSTSFWFVEKGAKPVNCDTLEVISNTRDRGIKRSKKQLSIIVPDDDDDDDDDDDYDETQSSPPKRKNIKRPPPINMASLRLAAPDIRAANIAQKNGEHNMENPFARQNNSDIDNMFDHHAPENFDDNPQFDKEQADRWREPFKNDGGRKRRNTRRRTRKYKSKRKQQTRKKTFRKRK